MNKANRENIDRVTIIMSYILFGESYLSLRVNDYIICQFICAICAVPPVPVHRYWYNAPYSSIMRRIESPQTMSIVCYQISCIHRIKIHCTHFLKLGAGKNLVNTSDRLCCPFSCAILMASDATDSLTL